MSSYGKDPRKDFILATSGNYFGYALPKATVEMEKSDSDINNFLDDGNCFTLFAVDGGNSDASRILFNNKAITLDKKRNMLVFFKLKPVVITADNFHENIFISSLFDTPTSSLYHAIHKVYGPLILKDDGGGQSYDPKLLQMVNQLELNLLRSISKQKPSNNPVDALNLDAIVILEDEVQFWSAIAKETELKEEKIKAQSFLNILMLIEKDVSSLNSIPLLDCENVLDDVQNSLDDLWKLEDMFYPQQRMHHMLDLIGNDVTRSIQSKFKGKDVWNDSYREIDKMLNQASSVCHKWIETCHNLTSLFWPSYTFHPWRGDSFIPNFVKGFKKRLLEISHARTMHHQLVRLLSDEEQESHRVRDAFIPFSGMNPVQFNPYSEPLWQVALKNFEAALSSSESCIASKLRGQLDSLGSPSSLQLFQEFKRYLDAVERPSIARALIAHRENLLASLMDYIRSLEKGLLKNEKSPSLDPAFSIPHLPQIISKIYWARQLESKVADIDTTSSKLLNDLMGYEELKTEMRELLKGLREYSQNQYNGWLQDITHEMKKKTLSLSTDEPVVTFEESCQFMKVRYNKRLVGLVKEVKQLSILGFRIPTEIKAIAEKAKQFAQQAKSLEQVANFHNTIGDRMIPSQRPMMLQAALELSRLVHEEGVVTWSNTAAVNAYIDKLKAAVERLSKENNRLASYHLEIHDKAVTLLSADLLHHQHKWKETMSDVRSIMSHAETQGFSDTKSWKIHWDHQFYKVLEYQYQISLEALNEHFPEMKVDLVFRQQRLQFQPPIEEIRSHYYGQLRHFLAIPKAFRGAGGEEQIFPFIIERNAHQFGKLFEKAEALFCKLEDVKLKYSHWVALGMVDVDYLVREHLVNWQDWDMNFKASKAWEQQIAKLSCQEERVECFCVSVLPVRADIEVHNRRFWDLLASSLQACIFRDAAKIEQFANGAIEALQFSSTSLMDISTTNAQHAQILKEAPEMNALLLETEKKNKTLASWTKETVDRVKQVSLLWDSVQSLLNNYEVIISKQLETIKINLTAQAENLTEEVKRFALRWEQARPREESLVDIGGVDADQKPLHKTLILIRDKRDEWNSLMLSVEKLNTDFLSMGMEALIIPESDEVENDIRRIESMWSLFDEFNSGLKQMAEEEWIVFRSKCYKFDEFLIQWCEKLDLPEGGATSLTVRILQEIEGHKDIIPVLKYIRGDTFGDNHWHELLKILGIPDKQPDSITFGDILNVRHTISKNVEALKELNVRAASEIVIRQALNELDIWEVEAKFNLIKHNDSQGRLIFIVSDYKDVLNKVGDHQCLLQSVKNSSSFEGFSDRVAIWETRLADLDEYLRNLALIQRKWLYLEPIFGSGVLASEGARFSRVDADFRWVTKELAQEGLGGNRGAKVSALCRIPGLRQVLTSLIEQLTRCQRSLNEFLEEKRSNFPRFYFLGDEDLLEILGQSTKEKVIQAHLKKLFAGIHSVMFDENCQNIIAMKSQEGEVVHLKNQVQITNQVEEWLNALSIEMRATLKDLMKECIIDCRDLQDQLLDLFRYPSQIHCIGESVIFCERCELSIRDGSLPNLLSSLQSKIDAYTELRSSKKKNAKEVNSESSNLLNVKVKALLLDTIHFMSITEELISSGTALVSQWTWQKQLRFYSRKDGSVVARMGDAEFEYTFEYQGNAPKIVHTPLTDKCFLTLMQAMSLGLGANPYGPAGTGKTESVKALGSMLGRQVLVFNCDQGIDVKSMERIFVGIVKCGAWGCFDEFNRLKEVTMSSVSTQIQLIQVSLRSGKASVRLMDQEIHLDHNCGIFITMNPAGKGYGDRRQLPNNLKQLFRPVVMSQPDSNLIAEVVLRTEGFKNARMIGRKLVEVFHLASKILTQQQHYDWGLRALKTVLHGCGTCLKSISGKEIEDGGENRSAFWSEEEVARNSLRLHTLSKLTPEDCARFESLVNDVFNLSDPNSQNNDIHNNELADVIRKSFSSIALIENDRQIKKCLEVYEQLQQRMGVVVVGPPKSGKSTVLNLLKTSLLALGRNIKVHTINPKAMPRTSLLGSVDTDTREWSDGILTLTAQQVYAEPSDVWSWLILDGDIDPEWIECLNSVLDDNRLLTLPSGWRIQFGRNVNFLFETHDLSKASPATISRIGVILLSEEDVDPKLVINSWLKNRINNRLLSHYIDDYLYKAVEWVVNEGEVAVGRSAQTVPLLQSALVHLEDGVDSKAQLAVALIRGLGPNLSVSSRENFAKQILEWMGEGLSPTVDSNNLSLRCYYNSERGIIDLHRTERRRAEEVHQNPGSHCTFSSGSSPFLTLPLILTADMKGAIDQLRPWLENGSREPFIIVGPTGCGKSTLLSHCFTYLRATEVTVIHCSAQITPQHVLQKLNHVCMAISNNTGRVYQPKNAENLILFFKNLHLVKPDKWGTNMLISFLQQLFAYHGFHDDNLEWIGLDKVHIIATMSLSPTEAQKITLSPRFLASVRIFSMSYPDKEQLTAIYSTCMSHIVGEWLPKFQQLKTSGKIPMLVESMIKIYLEVKNIFSNIEQSHYNFSPQDVTHWCLAFCRYQSISERLRSSSINPILEVLIFEACCIFRDKLVKEEDRLKFDSIIRQVMETDWKMVDILDYLKGAFYVTDGKEGDQHLAKGEFPLSGLPLVRLHHKDWSEAVRKAILQYEKENESLDLIIIPELVHGVAKAERVLTAPGGSLLLVGRSGYGRRSAIKIVSSRQGARLVCPSMGLRRFSKDLKCSMQLAGVDGEQVYLLVEDHHIEDESALDMVLSVLSAGEVPGLHTTEELDSIGSSLRDLARQEDFPGSLMSYFIGRVRKNLHLIINLDFTDPSFRKKFGSNNSLINHCKIQWFNCWSCDTMVSLPKMICERDSENFNDLEQDRKFGWNIFYEIHSTVSTELNSPCRYLSLVRTFKHIYISKKTSISSRIERLQAGVSKLTEARSVVEGLKKNAAAQKSILTEKQEKANEALQAIAETMRGANVKKSEMEALREKTIEENKALVERKAEIDHELSEVEPLVKEAAKAVGEIKSEALAEIRSLRAPPEVVRDILEGVLRLMGIQDTSWNSMKIFLSKRGVKEEIRAFDAHLVQPGNREAVEVLLREHCESFNPKVAKRASIAAAPLAAWVRANVKYSKVLQKIHPLEKEQETLVKNLKFAEHQLSKLALGLADVEGNVEKLQLQLSVFSREAAETEVRLSEAQETLRATEGLVSQLQEEYNRWRIQVRDLSKEMEDLPWKVVLAAAFVTYLLPSSEDLRRHYLQKWEEMIYEHYQSPISFNFCHFLSSERELLQCQGDGLPADVLSSENAVAILKTPICPLIIDPSMVCRDWLVKHLQEKNTEVVSQEMTRFDTTLELAVRFGKVLVVEDVECIHPHLIPVLRGDFVYQGTRKLVLIGEKLVDFNKSFKIFLITQNENLEILSSVMAAVTYVNFTITETGLAGQLLSSVLQYVKPELDEQRIKLLKDEEQLVMKLDGIQENLLQLLATAQGDILQNKELLNSLNETKASCAAVTKSLSDLSNVRAELYKECDSYRPLTHFGSALYFATFALGRLKSIYQYSASSFIRLVNRVLENSETEGSAMDLKDVQQKLLRLAYYYVSRSLFKEDRLIFALHLTHKMFPERFSDKEWELFTGQVVVDVKSDLGKAMLSLPSWVEEERIYNICQLKAVLPKVYAKLNLTKDSPRPNLEITDDENIGGEIKDSKLTTFQKVLVAQAFVPDILHNVASQFSQHTLGLNDLSPVSLSLRKLIKESLPNEPIMLIVSAGVDPSEELRALALDLLGNNCYQEVALGQQGSIGWSALAQQLQEAFKSGKWMCMKNLHLAMELLPLLEREIRSFTSPPDQTVNFRLWLITELHPDFSPTLARASLKVTYESPPGIKKNLQRTLTMWGPTFLCPNSGHGSGSSLLRSRALFSLAFFHAIVQERRTFIPQGWYKSYEFGDSDLRAASTILDNLLSKGNSELELEFIQGLIGVAIYGGYVDNVYDFRVLSSYISEYFDNGILTGRSQKKLSGLEVDLPFRENYSDFLELIQKLPDIDRPSIFGLPENVERSWQRTFTAVVIEKLKDMMHFTKTSDGFDKDRLRAKLSPILNMWKKLIQSNMKIFSSKAAQKSENKEGQNDPIAEFFHMEYMQGISLVQEVHRCLTSISKVIRGLIMPDYLTLQHAEVLMKQQVPSSWQVKWEGPKEPHLYLQGLLSHAAASQKFSKELQFLNMSKAIDLSDVFCPIGFLGALKQKSAREYGHAADSLKLICSWAETMEGNFMSAKLPIKITGLQIEGAIISDQKLSPCSKDSASISTAPDCIIAWVPQEKGLYFDERIVLPVYQTEKREILIVNLDIPCCQGDQSKWIQAGVALFLHS